MDVRKYRDEIDRLDGELVDLFQQRMRIAEKIALEKLAEGKPVLDADREKEKLCQVKALAEPDMEKYIESLFHMVMDLSKDHQGEVLEDWRKDGEIRTDR